MPTNLGSPQSHHILIHGISLCVQQSHVYWQLLNLLNVNNICFLKKEGLKKISACQCSFLFHKPWNDCCSWVELHNQKEVIKEKKLKCQLQDLKLRCLRGPLKKNKLIFIFYHKWLFNSSSASSQFSPLPSKRKSQNLFTWLRSQ